MTAATFERLSLLRRDQGQIGASLDRLADQLRDGWHQASRVKIPASYRQINRVVICGMGGSHLGADILRSALFASLKVPVMIVADYNLPAWVDTKTLVVCSSYSGSTEETLAAMTVALKRRAKVVVVTSGGALASRARREKLPLYLYRPTENPSGQPRLGVAYGMMAMLSCWRKLGLIKLKTTEIERLPMIAWEATKRYGQKQTVEHNVAKQAAMSLADHIPFLIGAEWTAGNLHTFVNQIHENAKTYADWKLLPDLNHHLLEGLRDRKITKQLSILMITDKAYHPRTQRRFALTTKILKQLGAEVSTIAPRGATSLEKAIDLLSFGGYVSWYLAAIRKVQPGPIPTVDALKKALAR